MAQEWILPPIRTRRSPPWGLAGMLGLVVLVEGMLGRHADDLCDWMAFTWRTAGKSARGPESSVDVLCLGDSLVKEGVLPRVLGRTLGRSSYNLAVHGGQAPTSFLLLRRALEHGARPRVVVVDFQPNLLSSAPVSSGPYWPELVDARDAIDLGWHARDTRLLLRTVALGLFPALRNRDAIRAAILSGLRGEVSTDGRLCQALDRNFRQNLGARVSPVKSPPADPAEFFRNLPDRGRWKPHRANVAYVHRLFALAEKSGVTVFWLLPPTSPAWQARRKSIGAEAIYETFARSVLKAHRNVVVVDGRHAGYGPSSFYDLTHLHVEGATELSAGLGETIERYLASSPPSGRLTGDSWTALPAHRRMPRDEGLEDLDQSRLAVTGPAMKR